MRKKALLIGSSFSAAPILDRLRKRNLVVEVCGNLRDDPCHQYSDLSHFIDYSDREALLELVSKGDFDYIVPSCNDFSYMSAAWVAQKTGHVGFDRVSTAEILHKKASFREVTSEIGISVPSAMSVRSTDNVNLPEDFFPVLVKPVDSFSGRGVTKVEDGSGLLDAIRIALDTSRSSSAVIERFVEGTLHSHSAFVANGRIACDFFVDEFCTVYPYQVDCSNHPSLLPESIRTAVRSSMLKLIQHFKLADGLLHTQFIAKGSEYWIIETMRRCPGDLFGQLIERSTGFGYTDRYVAGFLGEKIASAELPPYQRYIGRHTISVKSKIIQHSFSFHFPGTSSSIVPLKMSGEVLNPAPYDKLAILFNEFETIEQMRETTARMTDFVTIEAVDADRRLI